MDFTLTASQQNQPANLHSVHQKYAFEMMHFTHSYCLQIENLLMYEFHPTNGEAEIFNIPVTFQYCHAI